MWKTFTLFGILLSAAGYMMKRYFAGAVCECRRRLDCKVVVITGANSGLGKALAFELASRGAIVVLACRDLMSAEQVCKEIVAKTANPSVYTLHLDLTSFRSIKSFVENLRSCEDEVYALVNNAAVFYHPREETEDGFDTTFQVNYLGVFLLTGLLVSLLKSGAPSRIINISSAAHHLPKQLSVKLAAKHPSSLGYFDLYGQSKLCLNLFATKLASCIPDQQVAVANIDPGNVETRIFRNFPLLSNPVLGALQRPLRFILVKTPKEGVQSILHAVLCPTLVSGVYIRECAASRPSNLSLREDLANMLWKQSLEWTDLKESQFLSCFK